MNTTDVKAFFDRVASGWDTMRIAWLGFTPDQVLSFVAAARLESPSLEALGRQ